MNLSELDQRISEIIPSAAFEKDNYGQVLIYTGLVENEAGQLVDFDPDTEPFD